MQSKGREHAGGRTSILSRVVAGIESNENRGAGMSLGPEKAKRVGNAPDACLVEPVVKARLPTIGTNSNYVWTSIQELRHQELRGTPLRSGDS